MNVVILGAGFSGLAFADTLSQRSDCRITVIEKEPIVGGMARTFKRGGIYCDLGSHRLHPSCPPQILDDLGSMIGSDLLLRPRNGVLCLRGKKVKFPLQPGNALAKLGPWFVGRLVFDMVASPLRKARSDNQNSNFKEVMEASLGSTLCRNFYFPYAQKLWGVPPEALSDVQARRRVASQSLWQIARKTFQRSGKSSPSPERRFYYPRNGSGQISDAYLKRAASRGVTVLTGRGVTKLIRNKNKVIEVEFDDSSARKRIPADWVFSTLPAPDVAGMFEPSLPDSVIHAGRSLGFRGMVLLYLELDTAQATPWDAHYFPEAAIISSRMSEPKNYSGTRKPQDRTIICLEVPCEVGDSTWEAHPMDLALAIVGKFPKLGIPTYSVLEAFTLKLAHAYPVYRIDYQKHLGVVLEQLNSIGNFVTFGRQGLFWYANMHHVIQAGQELADCFESGKFDHSKWREICDRMDRITVAD